MREKITIKELSLHYTCLYSKVMGLKELNSDNYYDDLIQKYEKMINNFIEKYKDVFDPNIMYKNEDFLKEVEYKGL